MKKYKDFNNQQLYIELQKSCEEGNFKEVIYLLTSPEITDPPTCATHFGFNYAFQLACQNNHLDIVKFFLKSLKLKEHANIRYDSGAPFLKACQENSLQVVEYLVKNHKVSLNYIEQGFIDSCEQGSLNVMDFFFQPSYEKYICNSFQKAIKSSIEAEKFEATLKILNKYQNNEIKLDNPDNRSDFFRTLIFDLCYPPSEGSFKVLQFITQEKFPDSLDICYNIKNHEVIFSNLIYYLTEEHYDENSAPAKMLHHLFYNLNYQLNASNKLFLSRSDQEPRDWVKNMIDKRDLFLKMKDEFQDTSNNLKIKKKL